MLQGVLYALPTLLMVVVFFVAPILLVARISASDWELLRGDSGINFPDNYTALGRNNLMAAAVTFTLVYTILATVLLIGMGLGLALLVQESGRWTGLLRTALLIPVAVGLASASLLAWGLYSPAIGPINPVLHSLGLIDAPLSYFGTPLAALLSTTLMIVWKYVGLYMLILLVGLQAIPEEVHEAAAIDGAGRWQTLRRVTLPLLRPALALALILCVTGSLLAFDQFFILTQGGPDNSTVTVVQLIYREAFLRQDLGTAAALSILVLLALLVLNGAQLRGLRSGGRREGSNAVMTGLSRTPYYVLTAGLAILFLFPLVWALLASVSGQAGARQLSGYGIENYRSLFEFGSGLPQYLFNSIVLSSLTVGITLFVSVLGGYAFARFSFPGKNILFLVTLAILMVPSATLIIPLYVLLKGLGLQNTLLGLAFVLAMFQLPFATFMMRISFEAVPREIEESALVDGCSTFGVLRRILLRAVVPGVITVGLFAFLAAWNEYFLPLVLITVPSAQPLPVAMVNMRQQTMGIIDYGATEAGVVVLAVPCVLLFLVLQRYYVRGFMSGAVKG